MNRKSRASRPQPVQERLQKVLAAAGLGSRRALEKKIQAGEILLNRHPAKLGQSVQPGDVVRFANRQYAVRAQETKQRTLIYNKAEGEVTTTDDPQRRKTVFDKLPRLRGARWIAIGRLDINTSGLLLFTTDGELANAMMHPSNEVDREYACRIRGAASNAQLQQLRDGVQLEDGMANFSDIQPAGATDSHSWYHVVIMEGRKREVRRLWAAIGLEVARLKRVRYGAVFLPKRLRVGQHQELTGRDHGILRQDVGLAKRQLSLTLKLQSKRHR